MPVYFGVCGTLALEVVEAVLREAGYRRVEGRVREPGEFRSDRTDPAPGWADWMYEVEMVELPEVPMQEILARTRALEAVGRGS